MLVLSRRTGQKIMIGNAIEIEVISVNGDDVRLGISAPNETSIHRWEVYAEIQAENRAAKIVAGEIETSVLENVAAHIRPKQQ